MLAERFVMSLKNPLRNHPGRNLLSMFAHFLIVHRNKQHPFPRETKGHLHLGKTLRTRLD